MSFPAKFHGVCSRWECDEPIEPGNFVDYIKSDLMHSRCASAEMDPASSAGEVWGAAEDLEPAEPERAPRPIPTCDVCWVPMPCFCDPYERDN